MKKGYWLVAYRTIGDEATMNNYVALAVAAAALGTGVERDFRIAEGA